MGDNLIIVSGYPWIKFRKLNTTSFLIFIIYRIKLIGLLISSLVEELSINICTAALTLCL